ncbi:MAG TPA: hypothetical protein VEK11_24060 [Thermoanaerobaculia bacterium]|nr:hypothetical protein [Thermoanaerobaculia bacterium]
MRKLAWFFALALSFSLHAQTVFEVHPSAIPANADSGYGVYILDAQRECDPANCTIRVGNDPALITPRYDGDHVVFDAPRANAGVKDVTLVRAGGSNIVLPRALAYFDPNAAPDDSLFEPILLPLLFNTKGANGSDWRSELAAFNPNPWPIESYNDLGTIVSPCIEGPCGERLGPHEFMKLDGGNFPRGHVLLVPRNDADDISISLRVRDVSRVAEGFGTEIPVVREHDLFRNAHITLLDVPVDPTYRAKVRIYGLGDAATSATLTIVHEQGARDTVTRTLERTCSGNQCAGTPAYAELDLPAGAAGERVDVLVALPEDVAGWAFVSVTNNETQQVTTVLPDGDTIEPRHGESATLAPDYRITTNPEQPVAGEDVEVRVTGYCLNGSRFTRTGNRIHIQATIGICDPPLVTEVTYLAGALPPGRYEVTVGENAASTFASDTFTVLPQPDPPFTVHPFAVPSTQLAPLELRIDDPKRVLRCPACTIRVNGVAVTPRYAGGAIYVSAPAQVPGPGTIHIEQEGDDLVYRGAFHSYDLNAAPDTALFERILFPVLFNAPGANGSEWRSEVTMWNPNPWVIETFNNIVPGQCIDYPCFERIPAGERHTFTGGDHPNGVALLTPREEAQNLAFSLRSRDVSRAAEGLGTAIPVVREKDMFADADLTLLDVPVESRYRVKLRVYAFDEESLTGTLVTHNVATNTRTRTPLTFTRTCNGPRTCAAAPAVAIVDLPSGAGGTRVNLFVEMPDRALGWAFATVTNNITQQVTIVTADGTGGEECSGCTMP